MNDWNGNGKYNAFDSYVDYKGANSHYSSGGSSDWWIWVLLAIVLGVCPALGVIIFLGVIIYYITDTYGSYYALNTMNKLVVVNKEEFATKFTFRLKKKLSERAFEHFML